MVTELHFDKMHFYWRTSHNAPNLVPDFLPFTLGFESAYDLIVQKHRDDVSEALHTIYKTDECVGYLDPSNNLLQVYGPDFLTFLDEQLPDDRSARILELGCGTGTLLKELKHRGYAVTGIDPNPRAKELETEGLSVITGFFPEACPNDFFDCLIHYDVLEHVEDPVRFLRRCQTQMSRNGLHIFAVPDCTEAIVRGDLSMLLHEHINYFDLSSMRRVLAAANLEEIQVLRSANVGTIYVAARNRQVQHPHSNDTFELPSKFEQFRVRALKNIETFETLFRTSIPPRSSVGLYVPLRLLPYLSVTESWKTANIRFFDDSTVLYKKRYDGFDFPVENLSDLKASPVDYLIIGSYIFGPRIRELTAPYVTKQSYSLEGLFHE